MVSSPNVTVFNRISLRKFILLLLLACVTALILQVLVNQREQVARLESSKKAEEARILAEEEAAKKLDFPEYSDQLVTDLFNALLAPPYEKLDIHGNWLDQSATRWQCVQSVDTNLVWEVKTNDGGLRDSDFTYSWFDQAITADEQGSGRHNGGACLYSDCDTSDYIERINKQKLCGISDWRLPTTDELASIVHESRYIPKIDLRFFPNAKSYYYWSNTVYANFYDPEKYAHFPGVQAFQYWSEILSVNDYSLMTSVNFLNGLPYGARKSRNYHIRLVSSSSRL